MSHSNVSTARDFYYFGVDQGRTGSYSSCNVSYSGHTAYSYSTAVAKVIPRKGVRLEEVSTRRSGSGLTLLSMFPMSNTTARHISNLWRESPFDVVEVPLERGDRDFTPGDLADKFASCLDDFSNRLNRAENRARFVHLVESLRRLREEACDRWAKPLKTRRFDKYMQLDVANAAADMKARIRKETAMAAAKARTLLDRYVRKRKGGDYCEFMHVLFDPKYENRKYRLSTKRRLELRKLVCKSDRHGNAPSYVWLDGETVVTSRGVSLPVREAEIAMRLWAAGKDMRTYMVGMFSVVSYTGDTIQIGCHRIPRENMLSLYRTVMGSPFPDKAAESGGKR